MITKPFYPKPKVPVIGLNIAALLGKRVVKGDVGIEIEVEGNKFKKEGLPVGWTYHKDGSLRGVDNAEYVLGKPIAFDKVKPMIESLWQMFQDYGSILDDSHRTSVHVHLNMQKFHLNRLAAFLAMYFSVEEILTQWCGEHRVGNLFCLRAKDATAIVSSLKRFIVSDGNAEIRDNMHYAGLNAQALHKFGSIEVRTLRGVSDPKTILDWVAILERIYKMSADFKDPRDVMAGFSGDGPMNYLKMVLGEHEETVVKEISWSVSQIRDSLYTGIRLAQDLCYCRDWSLYQQSDLREDPFGRDPRKIAASLGAASAQLGPTAEEVVGQYTVQSISNAWATHTASTVSQAYANLLNIQNQSANPYPFAPPPSHWLNNPIAPASPPIATMQEELDIDDEEYEEYLAEQENDNEDEEFDEEPEPEYDPEPATEDESTW